jgi:WD40 repeat protein
MGGFLSSLLGSKTAEPSPKPKAKKVEPVAEYDLGEHAGGVAALAASGHRIASAAKDEVCIRLWDAVEAGSTGVLEGHTKTVKALALSHNEGLIASASDDGTLRVWDVNEMKCIMTTDRGEAAQSLDFYPDGKNLAVGGSDGKIVIVEVPSGLQARELKFAPELAEKLFKEPPTKVSRVRISHDGARVVSLMDGLIVIWTPHADETVGVTIRPAGDHIVFDVNPSSDGAYLIGSGGKMHISISATAHEDASFQFTDVGGMLLFGGLGDEDVKRYATANIIFERAAFSPSANSLVALAAVPPANRGLPKVLYTFSLDQLRAGRPHFFTRALGKVNLCRASMLATAAFNPCGTLLAMEVDGHLRAWKLE